MHLTLVNLGNIFLVYLKNTLKTTPVNLPISEIMIRDHFLLGEHYAMVGRSDSVLPEKINPPVEVQ